MFDRLVIRYGLAAAAIMLASLNAAACGPVPEATVANIEPTESPSATPIEIESLIAPSPAPTPPATTEPD